MIQHVLDLQEHVVELDGLEQVVAGPCPQGRHRRLDRAVRGDHDHRRLGRQFPQPPQQRDAVHLGHADVREHQIHRLGEHGLVGDLAVGRLENLEAALPQQFSEGFTQHFFVFDEQYRL
ncbi:MAG: hypothetical protein NT031_16045 [Planctomycetota bacterium]|nr:hypothetical protein [Planctomycetota bacterium]